MCIRDRATSLTKYLVLQTSPGIIRLFINVLESLFYNNSNWTTKLLLVFGLTLSLYFELWDYLFRKFKSQSGFPVELPLISVLPMPDWATLDSLTFAIILSLGPLGLLSSVAGIDELSSCLTFVTHVRKSHDVGHLGGIEFRDSKSLQITIDSHFLFQRLFA